MKKIKTKKATRWNPLDSPLGFQDWILDFKDNRLFLRPIKKPIKRKKENGDKD